MASFLVPGLKPEVNHDRRPARMLHMSHVCPARSHARLPAVRLENIRDVACHVRMAGWPCRPTGGMVGVKRAAARPYGRHMLRLYAHLTWMPYPHGGVAYPDGCINALLRVGSGGKDLREQVV